MFFCSWMPSSLSSNRCLGKISTYRPIRNSTAQITRLAERTPDFPLAIPSSCAE
uniref:Uncharacterized protein n=1 Tax=Arundo donax TaxID=35708 RepID=A0A0A9GHB5_ARUDO